MKMGYGRFPVKTALALLFTSLAAPGFADMSILRQPVAVGVYEMVYNEAQHSVLVATTEDRSEQGGIVYELDPQTLSVLHAIKTDHKPFGAALNSRTHTAWFGGSIDGSLMAVDTESGKVKGSVTLVPQSAMPKKAEKAAPHDGKPSADKMKQRDDHRPPAPRELRVDEASNKVYVSGVNRDDSVLWIVDGNTMKLKTTLHGLGKLNTGLAIDSDSHRLYTTNADGEFITIDTSNDTVLARQKIVSDGQEHLLMNIALDTQGHRAFVADNKAATILVVDTRDDKVIHRIAAPESLSVLFNPLRNQLYAAHRNAGTVSVIDGTSYAVINTLKLPVHPNSLALASTGDVFYVSVKQESSHGEGTHAPDDVVRVSLK